MKSLYFFGLMALAVVSASGQTRPVYYSATKPDCSSLMGGETATAIKDSNGNTLGYSCYVRGTFVWLASGGVWGTSIRVSGPAAGDIDVLYQFFDKNGNPLSIDNTLNNDATSIDSNTEAEVPLFSNQPLEVELLGETGDGPNYNNTAEGSVFATFYCPDAATCANVLPQLIYSALPTYPWSLSVPISWDDNLSKQWSAVVNYDPSTNNVIGLVVYNADTVASKFRVDAYDANGNFVASGFTPTLQPVAGSLNGGTYAVLLGDLIPGLAPGFYKILFDGGSVFSAVEVLQINDTSGTTLQVAFDTAPGAAAAVRTARSSVRAPQTVHVITPSKRVVRRVK